MAGKQRLVLSSLPVFFVLFTLSSPSEFVSSRADAFVAEATEIISVVRIGVSLVEYIYKVFSHIYEDSGAGNVDWTGEQGRELSREILEEYTKVTDALDRLAESNEDVQFTIFRLRRNLPQIVRRELKLDRVDAVIRSINTAYRKFEFYQERKGDVERHTLEDFALTSTSHADGSIRSNLDELHGLVVPEGGVSGSRGIFELLGRGLESKVFQTIDDLWETLRDRQRYAIFTNKPGRVASNILSVLGNAVAGDIYALNQKVDASRWQAHLTRIGRGESASLKAELIALQDLIGRVELIWHVFSGYMAEPEQGAPDHLLEDFALSVVEPGSSENSTLFGALLELHNMTVPHRTVQGGHIVPIEERNDTYFMLYLALARKNNEHICDLGQSPHQLLFNLYNLVALAEIKGYAMIQFSYMMLRLYNKGNFSLEEDLARRTFESQAAEKLLAVKSVLPNLSREYYRCDPMKHKEGTTYVKMTRLLQGIIENEKDLSSLSSCRHNCAAYSAATHHGCYKNLFCAKQERCNGRLFECTFYDADAWVCMSKNSERRYDWVEYEDGTVLGHKGRCENKIKVDSWYRWLVLHCSYCVCKCDEPGPKSDRYWSLVPAEANVEENKVVTGVRFVKRNRVIQMEIQQATALPEGDVDEDSREWIVAKPVDIMSATNDTLMTLSYEQRALDTDRLRAPPGHVVTGVKLRNLGGHLNLEIQVAPISFQDGRLEASRKTWIGNDATTRTETPRTEAKIYMPDVPTNFHGHSKIDTEHNQFIVFDSTSPGKDVMQTTVPFIDAQQVSTRTGTWLSGVGLYHKGHPGFGGFVGAVIETFDYSKHLLPETNEKSARMVRDTLPYDFNEVDTNGWKKEE